MDNQLVLEQAFEESRYHRQFHQTIYTLYMTLYLALLGFLVAAPAGAINAIRGSHAVNAIFIVAVYLLVPGYVIYTFLNYHKTIASINSLIAMIAHQSRAGFINEHSKGGVGNANSAIDVKSLESAYDTLFFAKYYREVILKGRDPALVGRGHRFFIFALIVLVGVDFILHIIIFGLPLLPSF